MNFASNSWNANNFRSIFLSQIQQEDFESKRTATFVLRGMPVYQGKVTGRARVVTDLEQANSIEVRHYKGKPTSSVEVVLFILWLGRTLAVAKLTKKMRWDWGL